MHRVLKLACSCLIVAGIGSARDAQAQYFRNNAIQAPSISWMAFDSSLGQLFERKWGLSDQALFGIGYLYSLDSDWWWLINLDVGFGAASEANATNTQNVAALDVSTGIRYDFMSAQIRPYIAGYFHYMHQFVSPVGWSNRTGVLDWVALRGGVGLEYFVASDMSILAEAGYLLFLNIQDPFRQSLIGKIAYQIYF